MRKLLFETDEVVVIQQDFPTDTVFVTFNELRVMANGLNYWGGDFFGRIGVASIGVVTTTLNWYPIPVMRRAVEVIRRAAGGRRVVTYGFSHGGYGALKFSAALGADRALALSPVWSNDPEDVGAFDRRFISYFRRETQGGLKITEADLGPRNYLVYDPYEQGDAWQAGRICATAPTRTLPVILPFSLHHTVNVITEGGGGRALIAAMMREDPPTRHEIRRLVRGCCLKSETYIGNRVNALLASRFRNTQRILRCAALLPPVKRRLIEINLLAQDGASAKAEAALAELADAEFFPEGLLNVWAGFHHAHFLAGQLRIARLITAHFPRDAEYLLHATYTFLQAGLPDDAADALALALLAPNIQLYLEPALQLAINLRRPPLVEEIWGLNFRRPDMSEADRLEAAINLFEQVRLSIPHDVSLRLIGDILYRCGDDTAKLAGRAPAWAQMFRDANFAAGVELLRPIMPRSDS